MEIDQKVRFGKADASGFAALDKFAGLGTIVTCRRGRDEDSEHQHARFLSSESALARSSTNRVEIRSALIDPSAASRDRPTLRQ